MAREIKTFADLPLKIVYRNNDKNKLALVLKCQYCGQSMVKSYVCLWTTDQAGKPDNVTCVHWNCKDEFESENADIGPWFSRGWPALGYIIWPTDEELSKIKVPPKCVYVVRAQSGKVVAITKSYLRAYKQRHFWGKIQIFSIAALKRGALKGDPFVEKWLTWRKKKIRERRRKYD